MRRYTEEECDELAASSAVEDRVKAARLTATSEKSLLRLASNENLTVRRTVAKRNQNPDSVWTLMLNDENCYKGQNQVLEAAVRNPKCPAWVLDRLASHKEAFLRRGAGENPNASSETVTRLLLTPFNVEDYGYVEDYSRRLWSGIRETVVDHPNIPESVILDFLVGDDELRCHIASNPSLPVWKMRELVDSEKNEHGMISEPSLFIRNVASNQNCPTDLLYDIFESTMVVAEESSDLMHLHCDVMQNWNTDATLMERIYTLQGNKMAWSVFKNLSSNIPLSLLEEIASDTKISEYCRGIAVARLHDDPKYQIYPLEWVQATFLG